MSRHRSELLLILLIAVGVFCALLHRRDIVTGHEARVAQTARQMAANGWPWSASAVSVPVVSASETPLGKRLAPDPGGRSMLVNPWLVPVFNGQVRLQKPPLPYWSVATTFRLIGISEFAVRLPGALLGVLGALLIYDLAKKLFGRRAALPAALVWATTHFLVDQFRIATADPYLTFATLLAVWATVCRNSSVLTGAALGLGMIAKGPMVFVTALPAIIAYQLLVRRMRPSMRIIKPVALATVVFVLIAFPWYAYILTKVPGAVEFWRYESIGKISDNTETARPWWFYLGGTLHLPLPWTPIWLAGIGLVFIHGRRGILSPRGRRRLVPLLWYFVNLLFFSLVNVKKDAYLLPAIPGMILVCADELSVLLRLAYKSRFKGISGALATAQAAIGIAVAVVVLVLIIRTPQTNRLPDIIAGTAIVIIAAYALLPIFRAQPRAWLVAQSIAYAGVMIVLLGIQRPPVQNQRSARKFAARLAAVLNDSRLVVHRESLPEVVSYYLPIELDDSRDSNRVIVVVEDTARLIQRGKLKPDAAFFAPRIRDVSILDIRRVPIEEDGGGQWKAYELVLDRSRA